MASREAPMHDLVLSAVSYDALLVSELVALLAPRLDRAPVCTSPAAAGVEVASDLLQADHSRIAVVLAQRLWGYDGLTAVEAATLRDRARRSPTSVVVVALDDEPLAPWMQPLAQCRLAAVGVEGVAEFLVDAVASAGGTVHGSAAENAAKPPTVNRWPDPPTPYLQQLRAYSALRHQLDSLGSALEPRFDVDSSPDAEHIVELHKQPNRFVARFDGVGVSFSWVPGRSGTVADGRLMVIEWKGVAANRGPNALRTAHAVRERMYTAEASGADDWRWRADGPNGRASSTPNLVGEWMDSVAMTAQAMAAAAQPGV